MANASEKPKFKFHLNVASGDYVGHDRSRLRKLFQRGEVMLKIHVFNDGEREIF